MLSVLTAWALTIAAQQWQPTQPIKTPPTLGIPRGEVPVNVKPIEDPKPKPQLPEIVRRRMLYR